MQKDRLSDILNGYTMSSSSMAISYQNTDAEMSLVIRPEMDTPLVCIQGHNETGSRVVNNTHCSALLVPKILYLHGFL